MISQVLVIVASPVGIQGPALTPESSWGEILGFLSLGFLIVVATLACLSALCMITGYFFKRMEAVRETGKTEVPVMKRPDAPATVHAVPEQEVLPLAVIAATVAILMGNHHYRITHITSSRGIDEHNPWAQEGRRQLFAGHIYVRY